MRKIIWTLVLVILISFSYAYECQQEEVPGVGCNITTPGNMSCDTYSMYAENGTAVTLWDTMAELYAASGVYNFGFNQSQDGSYTIHLCDGSTTTIRVGSTVKQEVDSVEENQAVLEQLILDTQTNITVDMNMTLGAVYDRVMGIGLGTLIYDLLAELAGGYF